MARNGRAGQALAISAISAFTASIVSVLLLFTLAQFFADIAVGFGPVEIMAIMLLGFATISMFSDRKSTRLNSSHVAISYAVFCLKKKKAHRTTDDGHRRIAPLTN